MILVDGDELTTLFAEEAMKCKGVEQDVWIKAILIVHGLREEEND